MKKTLAALFLIFTLPFTWAQSSFEKGYIVNNEGVKINCYIKDNNWKATPSSFRYKTNLNETAKDGEMVHVKEFGIGDDKRFERHTVKIDRSLDDVNFLTSSRLSELNEETLFLQVLVTGKATLYYYESGKLRRFFYKTGEDDVQPLIYKRYYNKNRKIATNSRYRQQLFNNVNCDKISQKSIENLKYFKDDLIDYFVKYNSCFGDLKADEVKEDKSTFIVKEKKNKGQFNLSLRPSYRKGSVNVTNFTIGEPRSPKFSDQNQFAFGVELEYILPFHNNKWAVFVEPTFVQSYEGFKEIGHFKNQIDYSSIETPIGIRHYFFLGQDFKIFLNGAFIIDVPISNSELSFAEQRSSITIESGTNIGLGAGIKFKNKFSLEFRYLTERELLIKHQNVSAKYESLTFVLGYSFNLSKK
ncbi:porin family protein [Psychroflexus halocasei]|uniref:Outer membrane protein beta-barrel domain-containing protein n=1 Tax=Psychroflexus halocasei TaxID=908615 RepID=A0A1H4CJM6_9FLAO|nr:outer membrane beta-barrel protein [Psychroflexus halocasei]SEA60554.1 Outer membrane protein beta-barrel domain-containing protein [Psychroflexus halocasei]